MSSTTRESSQPRSGKRPLEDVTTPSSSTTGSAKRASVPSNRKDVFISQHHMETILAELEYERNMRQIEQVRAQQTQQRLAQRLELLERQMDDSAHTMQQSQMESERIIHELRNARNAALTELQQQLRLQEQYRTGTATTTTTTTDDDGESSLESGHVTLWKEKCRLLQEQVKAQEEREGRMKDELQVLRQEMQNKLEELHQQVLVTPTAPTTTLEDAPTALLQELNRTRVRLAETERQNRQLLRRYEGLEQRHKQLVQEKEQGQSAQVRVISLESKMRKVQQSYQEAKARLESWTAFGTSLVHELDVTDCAEKGPGTTADDAVPPEVATVMRHFATAQSQLQDLKRECQRREQQVEHMASALVEKESRAQQLLDQVTTVRAQNKDMKAQLDSQTIQIATLTAQQAIAQRELDSLRVLVQTFDGMPLLSPTASNQSEILASPKLQTSLKTMQVRMRSIQDELDLVTRDRDRLASELEAAQAAVKETQQEHERVLDKFGKLREALQAERAKVAKAEGRAIEAESLAGKGSFNPDMARALHLKETPLVEALREELAVLKRQLEAKGSAATARTPIDPEKLNQRLKENFKEQISLFREGVYLMTGYKVDMLPGTDRPTFRVRSVFAEQEEDHLMLKWPKSEPVSSLDLLGTDFAKALSNTPSYDYMVKFHSLPAFLASVQLSLFERQTLVIE